MRANTFSLWLLGAMGLALAGCSGVKQTQPAHPPEPAAALVWPEPPDPARIAYVRSVYSPKDLGIKTSTFGKISRWLTGSDKGNEALIKPFGVSLDENGNLCVTDTGSATVSWFDLARKKGKRWAAVGGLRFASPVAAAHHRDQFYVADSALGEVVVFNDAGKLAPPLTNHLERPSGLVVANDLLYVVDSQRHAVVIFDLAGNYRSEFGRRGYGPGEFNFPTHIGADFDGNIYVTDSMNGRIQAFDSSGKFQRQVGALGDGPGTFSRPKGAAVDAAGHLYVVDALFDNFQVFDNAGRLLLNVGAMGPGPGEFWMPNGIAISRTNDIFIADSYNRRLQLFKYVGTP
jgi:DNA-binding beta-propeller fold protein YncE